MMEMQQQIVFILLAGFALVFMVAALAGWRRALKLAERNRQLEIELASSASYSERLAEYRQELEEMEAALETSRIAEAKAHAEMEKHTSLAEQRLKEMQARMDDWAKQQEEFKQAAKASVMEAGSQMSTKLLEDHKREMEAAKKEQEKLSEKTTKELMGNFEQLTKSVAQIQSVSGDNAKQVETVMRALTHPAGAGFMAEVGLENSLKTLGLEPQRDYVLQYHVATEEGSNLRPDAVIFLPQDMVMVIDSKASKFFVELAEVEGTEREEAVLKQLVRSMHSHIDALARKQYTNAVAEVMKKQQKRLGRMLNVMYLPSDAAIEKLRKVDGSIVEKCEKADIILAGPASLQALFSLARQQISAARQDENQQRIVQNVSEVMDSMITALKHVDGVGKNIQGSAKKFDDFARSLNGRLLPKLRKLQQLGVEPPKNKELPVSIASYEVRKTDEIITIDAEENDDESAPLALAKHQ
ncbi:MAG: hypothetical protein CMM94_01365 [Rickettsiales bacterium]|nr:hypothetical protein [Rickettsiales bacterium]